MSITETEPVVVLGEAQQIQDLRVALRVARKRIVDAATSNEASQESWWRVRLDALYAGRLVEALDQAEDALFRVLNCASSYLECAAASRVIDEAERERRARMTSPYVSGTTETRAAAALRLGEQT